MANLATLQSGSSAVLSVTEQQSIVLSNGRTDKARLVITTGPGAGSVIADRHNGRRVYGPFGAGSITITAVSGELRYELSGDTVSPLGDDAALTDNMIASLVGSLPTDGSVFAVSEVTPYVTRTSTGTPVTGACELAGYDCTAVSGTQTITIYDGTSTSGTVIVPATTLTVGRVEFTWKRALSTGCHVVFTGAGSQTVNVLVG